MSEQKSQDKKSEFGSKIHKNVRMFVKMSDNRKSQILIFLCSENRLFSDFFQALIEMGHHDYVFWLFNHFRIILIRQKIILLGLLVSLRFYSEKLIFSEIHHFDRFKLKIAGVFYVKKNSK